MIREALVGEFQQIVGKENVLTSKEALRAYSYDGTTSWIHEPDIVLVSDQRPGNLGRS